MKILIWYFIQVLFFIAAVVTILGFIYRNKTDLKFKVNTNTNVYDIKAEVSKLNILYDSVNLKENDYMLSILTIGLSNDGFNNIKKDHFDSDFPIGIQIYNGKIIEEPELIDASSNYLLNAVKITSDNDSTITFSPALFDRNERISIKLLILHQLDETPVLKSIGKLSGQSEIRIIELDIKDNEYEKGILKGNIWIQIVRLLFYSFIMALGILIFLMIAYAVHSSIDWYYKKLTIRNFKRQHGIKHDVEFKQIFNQYLHGYDIDEIFRIDNSLKKGKELKDKDFNDFRQGQKTESTNLINELITRGFYSVEDNKIIINGPLVEKLIQFSEFIRERGFHIFKSHFGPEERIYGGKRI